MRYVTKVSIWHIELKGQDLNSYQKITALKEQIPLWDMWQKIQFYIYMKTRLAFLSKIHIIVIMNSYWQVALNKEENTIPLWDMWQKIQFDICHLELKGQDLNSYQKFTALNETANKIPLWDMWQKIQFDI